MDADRDENSLEAEPCEGCDGSGIRAPAEPSCVIAEEAAGWTVVERCDACELYADDLAAAARVFEQIKWVQCTEGGWHAIGKTRRVQASRRSYVRLTAPDR